MHTARIPAIGYDSHDEIRWKPSAMRLCLAAALVRTNPRSRLKALGLDTFAKQNTEKL